MHHHPSVTNEDQNEKLLGMAFGVQYSDRTPDAASEKPVDADASNSVDTRRHETFLWTPDATPKKTVYARR